MKRFAIIIGVLSSGEIARAAAIYEQPSWWIGEGTSIGNRYPSRENASGTGSRTYDNFSLPTGGVINGAKWRGVYVDSDLRDVPINTTEWLITISSDSGDTPGSPLSSSIIPSAQVSTRVVGSGMADGNPVTLYEFSASLPSFVAAPGQSYWFNPTGRYTGTSSSSFFWTQGFSGNGSSRQVTMTGGVPSSPFVRSGDRAFSLLNTLDLPMRGQYVPELQAVDALLQNFMRDKAIPGGTVAITHNGKVIYERGIGYRDAARSTPLQENAIMRLASVTKPITAAAIQQLAEDGMLSLNAKAFNIDGNGGILTITSYNGVLGDPRLKDITVQDLLAHRAGWNRNASDVDGLGYDDIEIANAVGVPSPPGILNTARYILSKPLQFAPGTSYAYSNEGYLFLGMIVEATSGQSYNSYVDEHVLAPAGIPTWEVEAGRTLADHQNSREPYYSSPWSPTQNVFDPTGPRVPWPYGGWDQESLLAYGGLIGSSKAVAILAANRILEGPEVGKARSEYTGVNPYPTRGGGIRGTDTVVLQSIWGDWTYSILFDRDPTDISSYSRTLIPPLNAIIEGLTSWPAAIVYPGDFTNDQWLTQDDIFLFNRAQAMGNETEFNQAFPIARYIAGDFDGNGVVNWADTRDFVETLKHSGVPTSYIGLVNYAADFDSSGIVDAVDLSVWKSHFGGAGTRNEGDANGDGIMDGGDFLVWQQQLGTGLAFASTSKAIPEPLSINLVTSFAIFLLSINQRRKDVW